MVRHPDVQGASSVDHGILSQGEQLTAGCDFVTRPARLLPGVGCVMYGEKMGETVGEKATKYGV